MPGSCTQFWGVICLRCRCAGRVAQLGLYKNATVTVFKLTVQNSTFGVFSSTAYSGCISSHPNAALAAGAGLAAAPGATCESQLAPSLTPKLVQGLLVVPLVAGCWLVQQVSGAPAVSEAPSWFLFRTPPPSRIWLPIWRHLVTLQQCIFQQLCCHVKQVADSRIKWRSLTRAGFPQRWCVIAFIALSACIVQKWAAGVQYGCCLQRLQSTSWGDLPDRATDQGDTCAGGRSSRHPSESAAVRCPSPTLLAPCQVTDPKSYHQRQCTPSCQAHAPSDRHLIGSSAGLTLFVCFSFLMKGTLSGRCHARAIAHCSWTFSWNS